MKIQLDRQQNSIINRQQQPQFKGAGDTVLRYLATNQAVGANAVDFSFMVAPRSASDMIKRGPAAGMETVRREIMGTINDSLIGSYGIVAGSLIAYAINNNS